MNLLLLAVVLAAPPQAPVPPQGPPVDEARVRQIVRDELKSALAALESQPRASQPVPAAAVPPPPAVAYGPRSLAGGVPTEAAPPGFRWEKDGTLDGPAPWLLVPTTTPLTTGAFLTQIGDAICQITAPSGCPNGQCPTPRRR